MIGQFYDMDYFDFIADPVRELEVIYRHFGMDFTDAARAAAQATHAESKRGLRAPKHTYSLADYGLTDEQVKDRFKGLWGRGARQPHKPLQYQEAATMPV
jgi:hypothetical protein